MVLIYLIAPCCASCSSCQREGPTFKTVNSSNIEIKYGHAPHQGVKPSTTVLAGRPAVNYCTALPIFKCSLDLKNVDILLCGPSRLVCMLMTVQWIFHQGSIFHIYVYLPFQFFQKTRGEAVRMKRFCLNITSMPMLRYSDSPDYPTG
jgi:hypothetical protein